MAKKKADSKKKSVVKKAPAKKKAGVIRKAAKRVGAAVKNAGKKIASKIPGNAAKVKQRGTYTTSKKGLKAATIQKIAANTAKLLARMKTTKAELKKAGKVVAHDNKTGAVKIVAKLKLTSRGKQAAKKNVKKAARKATTGKAKNQRKKTNAAAEKAVPKEGDKKEGGAKKPRSEKQLANDKAAGERLRAMRAAKKGGGEGHHEAHPPGTGGNPFAG